MLLAVDVGNTNIVFGIYSNGAWQRHWRIQTVHKRMPDEYAVLFGELLREAGLSFDHFDQAIIGSVVPQLTRGIRDMIASRSDSPPLVLSADLETGIEIRTDHPNRVGSDLIADAVAAYDRFQSNCIVVDFGTATTITAVAEPGELLGTAIGAGLNVTIDALVSSTAQLPHIELAPPPHVIGKNTIHSMQSGLVLGYVYMVEGLVDRMRNELGGAQVVATGGLSSIIAPLTDRFDQIDPWLTLDGLRIIAERNR
jgi:type III pantothenate kinase